MDSQDLQSQWLDHLGIVAGICNEIGLAGTIDVQMTDTGRKVNVGQAVQAKILNDDCLSRALDQLFKQGVTEVFALVSAKAMQVFGVERNMLIPIMCKRVRSSNRVID